MENSPPPEKFTLPSLQHWCTKKYTGHLMNAAAAADNVSTDDHQYNNILSDISMYNVHYHPHKSQPIGTVYYRLTLRHSPLGQKSR